MQLGISSFNTLFHNYMYKCKFRAQIESVIKRENIFVKRIVLFNLRYLPMQCSTKYWTWVLKERYKFLANFYLSKSKNSGQKFYVSKSKK